MKRLFIFAAVTILLLSACDMPDVAINITVNPTEFAETTATPKATPIEATATPKPTATATPAPTATAPPTPTATATFTPSAKPTVKAVATVASTTTKSVATPKTVQTTTVVIASPSAAATAEATPAATPESTQASGEITKLGSDYTSAVLSGINDSRSSNGLAALTTSADLNSKAEEHAKAMATAGKRFHSSYGLIESVGSGTVNGMVPSAAGARASVHASQLGESANVSKCGIGAYEIDGTIYLCIVANLD